MWGGYFKEGVKEVKRIFLILMIFAIILVMVIPAMAWDEYPNTPIREEYDSSYIYQVISTKGTKTWLIVSQTPYYKYENQYGMRIRSSSIIHLLEFVDDNWVYRASIGVGQGHGFDEILQSSHDIYTDSSLTSVFFSATRKTPMQETLTQHPPLTLMNPLIRGISPYLIGLLIVLAGFLKGLQLLFKTLRKA